MLRRLLSRLVRSNRFGLSLLSRLRRRDAPDDAPVFVRYNADGLDDGGMRAFSAMAAKASDMAVFNGSVEHAYDVTLVADPSTCPRCGSATEQQYASFIYATQIAPRVMVSPAGHFCAKCPSVVIDEELIQAGISDPRLQYQGVLGIDYGKGREPDFFKTWNGEDAVLILDEDQTLVGIGTLGRGACGAHPSPAPVKGKQRKKREREKASKRARKMNRKS